MLNDVFKQIVKSKLQDYKPESSGLKGLLIHKLRAERPDLLVGKAAVKAGVKAGSLLLKAIAGAAIGTGVTVTAWYVIPVQEQPAEHSKNKTETWIVHDTSTIFFSDTEQRLMPLGEMQLSEPAVKLSMTALPWHTVKDAADTEQYPELAVQAVSQQIMSVETIADMPEDVDTLVKLQREHSTRFASESYEVDTGMIAPSVSDSAMSPVATLASPLLTVKDSQQFLPWSVFIGSIPGSMQLHNDSVWGTAYSKEWELGVSYNSKVWSGSIGLGMSKLQAEREFRDTSIHPTYIPVFDQAGNFLYFKKDSVVIPQRYTKQYHFSVLRIPVIMQVKLFSGSRASLHATVAGVNHFIMASGYSGMSMKHSLNLQTGLAFHYRLIPGISGYVNPVFEKDFNTYHTSQGFPYNSSRWMMRAGIICSFR